MSPCTPRYGSPIERSEEIDGMPSTISVRGDVAFAPLSRGQRFSESIGGRPAAAARASKASTPASAQSVAYLGRRGVVGGCAVC